MRFTLGYSNFTRFHLIPLSHCLIVSLSHISKALRKHSTTFKTPAFILWTMHEMQDGKLLPNLSKPSTEVPPPPPCLSYCLNNLWWRLRRCIPDDVL